MHDIQKKDRKHAQYAGRDWKRGMQRKHEVCMVSSCPRFESGTSPAHGKLCQFLRWADTWDGTVTWLRPLKRGRGTYPKPVEEQRYSGRNWKHAQYTGRNRKYV